MSHIEIDADGARRGNPGRGGWGALVRVDRLANEAIDAMVAASSRV